MEELVELKVRRIDVDKILVGLSKLPYEFVFKLIENIEEQVKPK